MAINWKIKAAKELLKKYDARLEEKNIDSLFLSLIKKESPGRTMWAFDELSLKPSEDAIKKAKEMLDDYEKDKNMSLLDKWIGASDKNP